MSEATERCTARAQTALAIRISTTARTVYLDTLAVDSLVNTRGIQIVDIAFTCWTFRGSAEWARLYMVERHPPALPGVHHPALQDLRCRLVARAIRHQGAELSLARPAEELIQYKL